MRDWIIGYKTTSLLARILRDSPISIGTIIKTSLFVCVYDEGPLKNDVRTIDIHTLEEVFLPVALDAAKTDSN